MARGKGDATPCWTIYAIDSLPAARCGWHAVCTMRSGTDGSQKSDTGGAVNA